jgi:hypothetical protein
MKSSFRFLLSLLVLIGSISLACKLQTASLTPTPIPTPEELLLPQEAIPSPTPTPEALPQVPDTPAVEVTPPPPSQGEIELRFVDPASQMECVAHFPFDILEDGEFRKISGSGVLDCAFAVQQCGEGVCVTYHSTYYMEGSLNGVIQATSPSYPDGALDAGLVGTFTMKQYWTDIPPETVMPFTEDNPFEVTGSDIIPLFFHFIEGATNEVQNSQVPDALPWVFTLHLN